MSSRPILILIKITLLFFVASGGLNAQISSYPFIEDFENGAAGWTIQGTNTSWELGTPTNAIINSAASGSNTWVTSLNGNYLFDENGWVQSPVFDFSSMTNPIISLYVFWNCEYQYDGAVIQSSIDSGATWQNIGVYGTDPNWFTYDNIFSNPGGQSEGWSGTIDDSWGSYYYYNLSRDLLGLEGQSNVIIRVVFASDGFINDEGVAFDLVKIRDCYAGEDNNLFTCVNSSSGLLSLNSLLDEKASLDGTWTSNNSLTILENDQIDLSQITATDLYDFTYTVSDFGCFDQASIVISAQLIPYAGEDLLLSICPDQDINLYSYLDSGTALLGTWISNDGLTIMNQGNLFQPQISIGSITDGTYTFSYSVSSPNCGSDTSEITLSITKPLSPGENSTYDCSTLTSTNELFAALGGNPDTGGRWEPIEGNASFGNAGTYRYIHDATSNCPETSAEVIFTASLPDAGLDGEYFIEIVGDEGTNNLDAILSQFKKNSTGNQSKISRRWVFSIGPRTVSVDDTGDVDFPNTGAGPEQEYVFVYTVENDCGEEDSAIITIYISGWNPTNEQGAFEICEDQTASQQDLFDSLTKEGLRDLDNVWLDENNNVVTFPVGPGIYYYEDFSNNTANVTVTQISPGQPNAGLDREYYLLWGQYNLNNVLTQALSGKNSKVSAKISRRWSFQSGTRPTTVDDGGGVDFPNTGAGGEEDFTFIYTVENECGETDEAIITFYINDNNSFMYDTTICEGDSLTRQELFDLIDGEGNYGQIRYFNGGFTDFYTDEPITFPVSEGEYSYTDWTGNYAIFFVGKINSLNTKVFLQGAMLNPNAGEEHLMRDDLRVLGHIPTTSPYDDTICDPSVFNTTGNNAIVDWILIEFIKYGNLEDSRSVLLQRDGDIVDIEGFSPICLKDLTVNFTPSKPYKVIIKHRNHLGIMTLNDILVGNEENDAIVDYSDANNLITYGTNAQSSFGMPTGILGMWAGDADNDGNVGFANDGNQTLFDVLFHPNNVTYSSSYSQANGYLNSDTNMDGIVSFQDDLNSILTNVIFYPDNTTYSSSFGLFNEQLPIDESAKSNKEKLAKENQEYIKSKIKEVQQK